MKSFVKHLRHGSLAVALLSSVVAWGQSATDEAKDRHMLNIGLQLLTHGELRNGGLNGEENESDEAKFLMNRARLTLNYRLNPAPTKDLRGRISLESKVVVHHLNVWGMKGNTGFNLFEGWAKLTDRSGLFLQAGRQALSYDDERIIGPNDWAMGALSHDVLKLGYEGHGHKAHVILGYNQNSGNVNGGTYFNKNDAVQQPYKTMTTLWYHYDVPKVPLGVSLLMMNMGMQAGEKDADETSVIADRPRTEYQQLLGGYLTFRPKHFSIEGSYYRQMGTSEVGIDIKAWMASAKATLSPASNYGFEVGFDYLSGDKYMSVPQKGGIGLVKHDVIRGFNLLYGSHHKFYGAMDFFYVSAYLNGFTPGLQNAYVGAYFSPMKNLKLEANYHYLATATKLTDLNMTLGHEIELQASYRLMKEVSLSAGFSFMTGTETMERLKRASKDGSLRWGWFSLNISPSLFTAKW